jgi:hypothetical protein
VSREQAAAVPTITGGGEPSDEELAAIMAAISLTLAGGGGHAPQPPTPSWRFSGRWWTKPIPTRRDRP